MRVHLRGVYVAAALCGLAVLLAICELLVGRMALSPAEVFQVLLGHGDGGIVARVVLDIRLPRALTALFAGAALGISGAIFQSVSRNALGSPDVIGFTVGAATGAIAQIVLFGGGALQVALAAVLGGCATAVLVYLLSLRAGVSGGYRLVLVGVGIGAILDALNGLMLVKGDLDTAVMANLWRAGSLDARTWDHAVPVLLGVVVLLPLVQAMARRLELIEMGDDLACQLGIGVERTRLLAIACGVVLAALATGAAGPIAFVALAAPQLAMRLCSGGRRPVLASAAMAACLLLVADLVAQLMPWSITLPIGRMTGMVGGAYLLWLLTRQRPSR
ncbi:iron chelate uptake ABC transporter family permease subunit [Pseudoxanthomonas sp.]|uniref:FecCD family ABC transporter permease n=1 Tax=Pseudoxanthomonas sp. TaxID=1871049 RepID=UPI002614CA17|nr:iron chelate uptake ABC transporter family permease subunit [Pseudoxanthomonas sp.]WDS37899.1 MAG: iron chelate uptake ABC transporter family permease subunit [Pseudoxanthomonas sp.]